MKWKISDRPIERTKYRTSGKKRDKRTHGRAGMLWLFINIRAERCNKKNLSHESPRSDSNRSMFPIHVNALPHELREPLLGKFQFRENKPFFAFFLKRCRTSLMQALGSSDKKRASYAPYSKSPSVSLTRSGLPRVIPAHHRRVISQGGKRSELVVRCYLTIFSLYRVIDVKGKIDLSNIE